MIDEGTEFGARRATRARGDGRVVDDRDAVRRAAPAPGGVPVGRRRERLCTQPAWRADPPHQPNPKVTMNFRGDANGGDIVVLSCTAEVDESGPSAAENSAWVAKYATEWERFGVTAESFAQPFSPRTDSHQCRPRILSAGLTGGNSSNACSASTPARSRRPDTG
jgi:hypothetical protein